MKHYNAPATMERLLDALDDAAAQAWKNLARYQFDRFGYYAARWVTLNRILGGKHPNPFKAAVRLARQIRCVTIKEVSGCR